MAGKKRLTELDFDETEMDFNPEQAAEKLPVDISGGKKPLMEYMSLPIHLIDPFSNKRGSDFSDYDESLSEAMIDSIKKYGVMEAITVRAKPEGRYELLAGERRWTHAKKAGLTEIPAHVINADAKTADAYFSLTNILRRPICYRDLIYGWWQFYLSLKESGRLMEMKRGETAELSPEMKMELGIDGKSLSYRQMMRYVKMHNLIGEWVSALDKNETTLRAATIIASLPDDQQRELLPYIKSITEENAKELVKLYEGKLEGRSWNLDNIQLLLNHWVAKRTPMPQTVETKAFNRARPKMLAAIKDGLRYEDYDKADEVIKKALALYYSNKN